MAEEKKQRKRKILLLSDHALSTSGVGVQSRWLCFGLIEKGGWCVRQIGGAIKHGDYKTIKVNDDFIIKPVDGFGGREMLQHILAQEKPDVLLLFTDPRFFIWVWEMEEEIHQICPIAYWHLWDNGPAPDFNRVLYESTDLINCINWPTYQFCKKRWPEKTNFIPHALPKVYKPLTDEEIKKHKHSLLKGRCDDHFIGVWVNRNARRKQPGDVLQGWKIFLDKLEAKHGHRKATLIMHTDPIDKEGPNLFVVADMLGVSDNIFFSTARFEFEQMNVLYNISDFCLNRSSAEGFGLSTLEAMQAGKPIVVLKTGGLTRQVVDPETGFVHGIGLEPEVKSLVGSQMVPAIYDDYVSNETVAQAILDLHEMGPEKRKEIGKKAREYVLANFTMERVVDDWDRTLTDICDRWENDRSSIYKPWEARIL